MSEPVEDGYCFDVGPVRSENRGWVKLCSAVPFAAPRIRLNGLGRDRDLEVFRATIRLARDIASRPAFDFCAGPKVSHGPHVRTDAELGLRPPCVSGPGGSERNPEPRWTTSPPPPRCQCFAPPFGLVSLRR